MPEEGEIIPQSHEEESDAEARVEAEAESSDAGKTAGEDLDATEEELSAISEVPEVAVAPRSYSPLKISRRMWDRTAVRDALWVGIVMAAVSCALGLYRFASTVLPHIVSPRDPIYFQEVPEGIPVPRLLAWPSFLVDNLTMVQEMNPVAQAIVGTLLVGVLLRIAITAINPSFRLFRAPLRNKRDATHVEKMLITLEARFLKKATRVLAVVGLPTALLILLTARTRFPVLTADGRIGALWAFCLPAAGAALWIGFHRYGIAGNFARPRLHSPRRHALTLMASGALFGLGCAGLMNRLLPPSLEPRLTQYQMLGTFHIGYFLDIAGGYFGAFAGVGFAIGTLLCALGRPHLSVRRRVWILGLTLIGCFVAWGAERPFTPQAMAARLDITKEVMQGIAFPYFPRMPMGGVPNKEEATAELARRLNIPVSKEQPTREALVFDNGFRSTHQRILTDDGLPVNEETVNKAKAFLSQRNYRSALSWVATRYLYNVACIQFDIHGAIAACLNDQERGPHMMRTSTPLREMLFTCAVSPENRALLDRYADDRRFDFPDRESQRMIGDLYRRFGDVEKALEWYRRAEMSRTFLQRIRTERPMFHQGKVTGRITYNGQPLTGMEVGVIPIRLNGLAHDLEARLMNAEEEIAPSYFNPRFTRFDAYRAICGSGKTDRQGIFSIDNLVEGEYLLIIALPVSEKERNWKQKAVTLPHIVLNYGSPHIDMGTIPLEAEK